MRELEKLIDIGLVLLLFWLSTEDLRKKEVSARLLAAGSALSITGAALCRHTVLSMIGGIIIGALLLLLEKLTYGGIGKGDGLAFFMFGIWLGFLKTVGVLLIAFFLAGFIAIVLLAAGKVSRKGRLPFLPFVFLGYLGVMLR